MGRLIDADKLKIVNLGIGDYNIWGVEDCNINNAPTVEAISKADYENRLKADMVAILKELKSRIEKLQSRECYSNYLMDCCIDRYNVTHIIQQKIHELNGE